MKELYVDGTMGKTEYNRRTERYKQQFAKANGKLENAPDLGNLEQRLTRFDSLFEVVPEWSSEEQREAIDALLERAEERDEQITRVISREKVRGLLDE